MKKLQSTRDDEFFYKAAEGARLVLTALAICFCIGLFAASLLFTDAEISRVFSLLIGE